MQFLTKSIRFAGLGLLVLLASTAGRAKDNLPITSVNVAVIRAAGWSEGDSAREGAAEMVVLLEVARLRQQEGRSGLVAVGDRRGLFSMGAEQALCHAVLQGVPVVKLAGQGRVLAAPHGLFLDGGSLSEDEARSLLVHCLKTYGALPVVTTSAHAPVPAKLRAQLQLFQKEFTQATGLRVATR